MKVKTHNEYFRTVKLGGRKSCPRCKAKLLPGESVWSWGEYVSARWYTVMHFCKSCHVDNVAGMLKCHIKDCGCEFKFIGYQGERLPDWLVI